MTSTAASTPPDKSERSDGEIPRWRLNVLRAARQMTKERSDVAVDVIGQTVDFNAITSREQHGLGKSAADFQPATRATQPRRSHRQSLAQFDGRRLVTQTGNKKFHAGLPASARGLCLTGCGVGGSARARSRQSRSSGPTRLINPVCFSEFMTSV